MERVAIALVGLCALWGASDAAAPVLDTDNLGFLRGVQEFSEDNVLYFSFKGIRYAEPPIGPLRFKEPREAAPLSGEKFVNATMLGPMCLQLVRNPATLKGDEDCLRLNVYTPSYLCHEPSYPVVVFIHGGAFVYGNGGANPSRLVSRGVVVVTLNYRLGVLGFLSSGDRDLPGNLGLLDQQLALKWVQKNIHYFCGDRNNVTLAGVSAGGASTTLHMLSPGSKGLFHKVIATSGVVLNPWAQHFPDRERVRSLARSVGCQTSLNQAIFDVLPCLRSVNASLLVLAQALFQGWNENPFSPFGPVIDRNFLPEDPYKLLLKGKVAQVPLLLSSTTQEGLYTVAEFITNSTALAELDQRWYELAPLLLDYEASARTKEIRDNTSSVIRTRYFGGAAISNRTKPHLIQLEGDRHFVAGIDHFAKLVASLKGSKSVYMYQYSYRAEYSVSELWSNSTENNGVSHVDDLILILPGTTAKPLYTQADKNMSRSLVDIWASFIRRGVPVTENYPVWKPVPATGDQLILLNITSYKTGTLTPVKELGNSSFWRSLPLLESGFVNTNNIGGTAATMPSPRVALLLVITSAILRSAALE